MNKVFALILVGLLTPLSNGADSNGNIWETSDNKQLDDHLNKVLLSPKQYTGATKELIYKLANSYDKPNVQLNKYILSILKHSNLDNILNIFNTVSDNKVVCKAILNLIISVYEEKVDHLLDTITAYDALSSGIIIQSPIGLIYKEDKINSLPSDMLMVALCTRCTKQDIIEYIDEKRLNNMLDIIFKDNNYILPNIEDKNKFKDEVKKMYEKYISDNPEKFVTTKQKINGKYNSNLTKQIIKDKYNGTLQDMNAKVIPCKCLQNLIDNTQIKQEVFEVFRKYYILYEYLKKVKGVHSDLAINNILAFYGKGE